MFFYSKYRHDVKSLTVCRDHGNDNRRRRGRTLYQNGRQYADHYTDNRILQQITLLENFTWVIQVFFPLVIHWEGNVNTDILHRIGFS